MNEIEEKIIENRKENLKKIVMKNKYVTAFSLLVLLCILGAVAAFFKFIQFSAIHFILLGLVAVVSAAFAYFDKWRAMFYPFLAWIIWIATYVRTRNMAGLRDITTGSWTLGPDLDPFLFLRWAKYIVEHGSLYAIDPMRYAPLGYGTGGELPLTHYFIAWLYKIGSFGGVFESVTHAAVWYPVIMFALTVVVFFFMVRNLLKDELGVENATIAALISSLFLSVLPSLLPRTIAGIPEKESGAFLFMFLSFYFFILAWKERRSLLAHTFAILSGISAGAMALTWGGFTFLYFTIAPAVFISYMMGKTKKREIGIYALWIASSFTVMYPFSTRYNFKDLFTSIDTGLAVAVLFFMIFHQLLFSTRLKEIIRFGRLKYIPPQIISFILGAIVLTIICSILFGSNFIPSKVQTILANLVTPSESRLLLTVAENKQPYFTEWIGSFGPYILKIPITFWLFFIGSVYLFFSAVRPLRKKDRWVLTISYLIFLTTLIFSRYAPGSILNGFNFVSKFLYGLGPIIFLACAGYYLFSYHKKQESEVFTRIDFGLIFMFLFFLLSVVAARSSVRTVMVLDPPAAIFIGYIIVVVVKKSMGITKKSNKILAMGLAAIMILSGVVASYGLYNSVKSASEEYFPSAYSQQWQQAMAWVREQTPKSSVFGHWWDYGYWVQSIGERATILDGGNAISYWNHLMGRYALTGTDNYAALEFLYAHNATHFLIDSSDIGKYPAFASIGSNVNYDRLSSINSFYADKQQTQERKNSTLYIYTGGAILDEDIIYDNNGTKVFLPSGSSGLGGVLIEQDKNGEFVSPPIGIFVYNNQQYAIALSYIFYNGTLKTFNGGIDAGVFIYPQVTQTNDLVQIERAGALLYLSKRVIHSQLARLYLFNEKNDNFILVRSEDDFIVKQVKKQSPELGDFLDYGGVRGPLRIWEIRYPKNISYNPEFVSTYYPPELIRTKQ